VIFVVSKKSVKTEKKLMGKKGVEPVIWVPVLIGILLIVALILIIFFSQSFGKGAGQLNSNLENTGDIDHDNVPDLIDPCCGENPASDKETDNKNCYAGWTDYYRKNNKCGK
jgi:hypothetical protein